MEFIDFSKQLYRMCESMKLCEICRLRKKDGCLIDIPLNRVSGSFNDKQLAKIEAIVEKWAAEHPIKTRQSEFLKMFPNAPKSGRVLDICPRDLNIEYMPPKRCENISCSACKTDYWNEEVTDND